MLDAGAVGDDAEGEVASGESRSVGAPSPSTSHRPPSRTTTVHRRRCIAAGPNSSAPSSRRPGISIVIVSPSITGGSNSVCPPSGMNNISSRASARVASNRMIRLKSR
jgi:hypothetical protein